LADVEDRCDLEAAKHPGRLVGRRAVGVGVALVGAGGKDPDAVFAFADLPAEGLPLAGAGDVGGVGSLSENEDAVVRAVAVEAAGDVEHGGPVVAADECFHRGGELFVRALQSIGRGGHRVLPSVKAVQAVCLPA
jgi:hypothetical protein